jgi:hypothetical protein
MHMFYVLYHPVSSGKFLLWFMFKKLRQIYYPISALTVLRNPEYRIIYIFVPLKSHDLSFQNFYEGVSICS